MPDSSPLPARRSWREAWLVYLEPASLRMLALGFSAGLPLLLVLGTLSFRLREAGIDRTTIGYLSWVGLAYAFKWVWAPLVDRMPLPLLTRSLGRRRGWLLLAQAVVMGGLVGMALIDPRAQLGTLVWCALLVAFGSATQDIALDAFRIESADADRQAALAATYQTGYRLAMIWAGAGVLWVAARAEVPGVEGYQSGAWRAAYLAMAASMLAGMLTVLLSREPAPRPLPPTRGLGEWLRGALVEPFADFIRRHRWHAALILGLIAVHQGRGGRRDQGLRRGDDAGRRLRGRRALDAPGRDARADAGRGAQRPQQPAVRLAGPARARRDGAGAGGQRRQPGGRHRFGGIHRLPVQPDERAVLGHPVRAVQLDDAAAAQMDRGLLGAVRGRPRLRRVLRRHGAAGPAGAAARGAGV
jgi:hypothetical protein